MTDIPPNARILLVDLAFIGDLLMSTPAIACLRKAFPHATIDLLVSPSSAPVVERNPHVSNVITSTVKSGGWKALRKEADRIREANYDLAVSFHRGHGTLLMLAMSGVRNRIGFSNGGRAVFLTDGVPFALHRHRTWNHLNLLEQCLGITVDWRTPMQIEIDPEARRTVLEKLGTDSKRVVVINPNAAWPAKRWFAENFASVADALAAEGFCPVLTGSHAERPVSETVKSRSGSATLDLTGQTTLQELAALLSISRCTVTNDSGPMHIAQAAGTPVVAIFGPTDPARCGPWLTNISPVQADIDCTKCYRKTCWHMTCMKSIPASLILKTVMEILSQATPRFPTV